MCERKTLCQVSRGWHTYSSGIRRRLGSEASSCNTPSLGALLRFCNGNSPRRCSLSYFSFALFPRVCLVPATRQSSPIMWRQSGIDNASISLLSSGFPLGFSIRRGFSFLLLILSRTFEFPARVWRKRCQIPARGDERCRRIRSR